MTGFLPAAPRLGALAPHRLGDSHGDGGADRMEPTEAERSAEVSSRPVLRSDPHDGVLRQCRWPSPGVRIPKFMQDRWIWRAGELKATVGLFVVCVT